MNISIPPQKVDPGCPRPDLKRHDVYSSVRYGCTCAAALADKRRYQKLHFHGYAQPRRIDATGTRRRLQALLALGHSRKYIGECLGITERAVGFHMNDKKVTLSFAERVLRVYKALSFTPGTSPRTSEHAQRQGWVPPLAWDDDEIDDPAAKPKGAMVSHDVDELAVQLAVNGRLGDRKLTRRETHVAIRRLRELGIPTAEIARRTNVSERTVQRQGSNPHTITAAA